MTLRVHLHGTRQAARHPAAWLPARHQRLHGRQLSRAAPAYYIHVSAVPRVCVFQRKLPAYGGNLVSKPWCHQMEAFSTLLALCARNSPVTSEFPTQRPVTRSFDVFFDLHLNKRLSKSWGGWFETPLHSLWCHCNAKLPWGDAQAHNRRASVASRVNAPVIFLCFYFVVCQSHCLLHAMYLYNDNNDIYDNNNNNDNDDIYCRLPEYMKLTSVW